MTITSVLNDFICLIEINLIQLIMQGQGQCGQGMVMER